MIIHKNIVNDYLNSLSHISSSEIDYEDLNRFNAILEILVKYGKADINERQLGILNTALHFAVLYKQIDFINILLQTNNCNINATNTHEDTPLDFALQYLIEGEDNQSYEAIVKLLLAYGAKPNNFKQ